MFEHVLGEIVFLQGLQELALLHMSLLFKLER